MPSNSFYPLFVHVLRCLTQARRKDSVTGGAEIKFGGARKVYSCEFEMGMRNLSQSGLNEQGEDQKLRGIFRPKSEIQTVFTAQNR